MQKWMKFFGGVLGLLVSLFLGGEDFSEFEIEIEIEKANCTMV